MTTPTNVWEWILTVILFLISLSVLITLHELGHLSIAKAFNVYCREFSIGFGPALFRKKRAKGETYFAIRGIPLGGYVMMMDGETEIDPEDKEALEVPFSRTLNGISRPKRALIFSAGVITNAVLALILFAISNFCFPYIYASNIVTVEENSIAMTAGVEEHSRVYVIGQNVEDTSPALVYQYEENTTTYAGYSWLISDEVLLENGYHYVMGYYPHGTKNYTTFTDGILLFPGVELDTTKELENPTFEAWRKAGLTLHYYPDLTVHPYIFDREESFSANIGFRKYLGKGEDAKEKWSSDVTNIHLDFDVKENDGSFSVNDIGIKTITVDEWLPIEERLENTFGDFATASTAVFQGIGSLFTQGLKNMSGLVGIFQTSASIYSSYTFSMYLFFWGLISTNLAIFNLLPFPGLDGWSLLVTAIEGATNAVKRAKYKKSSAPMEEYKEWRIPPKVKGILSFIGLALIFLLMIAVIIMDVLRIMHIL